MFCVVDDDDDQVDDEDAPHVGLTGVYACARPNRTENTQPRYLYCIA